MVIDPRMLRTGVVKRTGPTGPVSPELQGAEHRERQRALSERAAQKRLTGGLLMRGPSALLKLPERELEILSRAGHLVRFGFVVHAFWSLAFLIFVFHWSLWGDDFSKPPMIGPLAAIGVVSGFCWALGVWILLRPAKRASDGLPVRTETLRDCMAGRSPMLLFWVRLSQWLWPVAWTLTAFTDLYVFGRGDGPVHADVTLMVFVLAIVGLSATLLILRDIGGVLADTPAQDLLWWGVGTVPGVVLMHVLMIVSGILWNLYSQHLVPIAYTVGLLGLVLVASLTMPCVGGVLSLGSSCVWAIRARRSKDGLTDTFRERWFSVESVAAEQRKQDSVARWDG
jgi:hypothetical protein